MTTGPVDAARGAGAPDMTRSRTDQLFADALCGPDGTGDPAVLMPVLQVYPDALSAPMPDAMVAVPPVDPAALLAAGAAVPTPAQARMAAQRATADWVPQPGRSGSRQRQPQPMPPQSMPPRPAQRRPAAPTWSAPEPRHTGAPHPPVPRPSGAQRGPTPPSSSAWTGRTPSPAEVAGFLRSTFTGVAQNVNLATQRYQPASHAPTPPLPRNPQRRRNKGSSVWAVLVFLVVIAFASGVAQQIINAVSGLFNR